MAYQLFETQFAGQRQRAEADESGRWIVRLEPLAASDQGRSLVVEGKNKISLDNVLVGDVWICSGQSNMEWNLKGAMNPTEEIAAAEHPLIRLFDVPGHTTAPLAQEDVPGGSWKVCAPGTVAPPPGRSYGTGAPSGLGTWRVICEGCGC